MTNAKPVLFEWQRFDLNDLASKGYVGLLAYEVGAGKTIVACAAVEESRSRVTLIVAPKSTFTTAWIPTLEMFGMKGRIIGNGKKDHREAMSDFLLGYPGVYLTTSALISRKSTDISGWSGDMLVLDEIHQMITPKSSAQRRISGYVARDGEPLAARFPMRIGLSGTPLRQSFVNVWGVSKTLFPEYDRRGEISDYNHVQWMFDRMDYVEVYTNQRDHNGQPKKVKQFLHEKTPGLWASEAPAIYIHKRREACCKWHGPKYLSDGTYHPGGFLEMTSPQVIERRVELAPAQQKAIRELQDSAMTYLQDNPLVADLSIVQQQRIRQMCLGIPTLTYTEIDGEEKVNLNWDDNCVSPFMDEVEQILSEIPEDEPVLLYLDSQRFAEVATRRLNAAGISAAEYSGKTSGVRDQYFAEFGKKYRVLVAVTSAFGTGTNGAQKICQNEIWIEQPIKLVDRIQVEGRTDRIGAKGQTQRYLILDSFGYAEGRLDDHLEKRLLINSSLKKA